MCKPVFSRVQIVFLAEAQPTFIGPYFNKIIGVIFGVAEISKTSLEIADLLFILMYGMSGSRLHLLFKFLDTLTQNGTLLF